MRTRIKVFVLMLIVLSAAVFGVTLINLLFGETYQLLLYDLSNGFMDNRLYIVSIFLLMAFLTFGGAAYWRFMSARTHLNIVVICMCIVLTIICVHVNKRLFFGNPQKGTWELSKTVGHSFGAVNGDDYTGSLEAFEYNYGLGRRTMEVDLLLSADNKLVLAHEWDSNILGGGISENNPPDEETFLNAKIAGKYTPLSFERLCKLMAEYPDIWIVTDTKSDENEKIRSQFSVMVNTARQLGYEEVLDRIIVQVYNEEMYGIVKSVYDFDNYIFTMYWRFDNDDWLGITRDVCRFCVNNGIETLTIGANRISPQMKSIADRYGRNVYIHTVNDIKEAEKYFEMGVTGIYTDSIMDSDLQ